MEDSSLRLSHDLHPLSVPASVLIQHLEGNGGSAVAAPEDLLVLVRGLADRGDRLDPSVSRLRGEAAFAGGFHSRALRHHIEAMVLYTGNFSKPPAFQGVTPEWEREMVPKMIKSMQSLGYHSYIIGERPMRG